MMGARSGGLYGDHADRDDHCRTRFGADPARSRARRRADQGSRAGAGRRHQEAASWRRGSMRSSTISSRRTSICPNSASASMPSPAWARRKSARRRAQSNRFLDRPVRAMDKDSGVGADLVQLRLTVEKLDPGRTTASSSAAGAGSSTSRSAPSSPAISTSINRRRTTSPRSSRASARGKDELLMDNAAIDTERANLWTSMGRLEQMIHLSKIDGPEARRQGQRARRDRSGEGQGAARDGAVLSPASARRIC